MEGNRESGSDYLARQDELREEVDKNDRIIKKANRVLKSKDAGLHTKINAALDMRGASEEQGMLDREIRDNIDDRLGIPKSAKTPDFDNELADRLAKENPGEENLGDMYDLEKEREKEES